MRSYACRRGSFESYSLASRAGRRVEDVGVLLTSTSVSEQRTVLGDHPAFVGARNTHAGIRDLRLS